MQTARHTTTKRVAFGILAGLAAAIVPMANVAIASDDVPAQIEESVVVRAPYKPMWRIVPPSTDPGPRMPVVAGVSALRGTVLHGEGDLLLLDLGQGAGWAVVRLPAMSVAGESIPAGWAVQAAGTPSVDGVMEALEVSIDPS